MVLFWNLQENENEKGLDKKNSQEKIKPIKKLDQDLLQYALPKIKTREKSMKHAPWSSKGLTATGADCFVEILHSQINNNNNLVEKLNPKHAALYNISRPVKTFNVHVFSSLLLTQLLNGLIIIHFITSIRLLLPASQVDALWT